MQNELKMATNETTSTSETVLETAGPPQPIVVKEEGNAENRSSSPDPSCSICLDNVTDAAYTDMCCHRFCFQCLVSWSRVKPECPLCKQRFSLIIHNVRSIGDYDELPVTWQDPPSPSLDANFLISVAFQRPRFRYRTTAGWSWRFHNIIGGPSSMSIANPILPSSSINPVSTTPISSLSGSVIVPISTAAHMFPPVTSNTYMGNSVAMEWRRRRQVSASEFRNTIYQQNQWVVPPQPRNGVPYRVRECSPSFYRNNPAQVNRLIPWLHRELLVLLDRWENYEEICQRVLDAITEVPIRSHRFHALMWPHLHDRTAHFIHEFYHFAVSPYDMLAYDLRAEYARHSPLMSDQPLSEHEINSDSSDIEVIELPEVRPELIEISDDDDDAATVRVTGGANDSDTSVEIIATLPPLALREPETINLVGDTSDSDIERSSTHDIDNGARNTLTDEASSAPLNNPDLFTYSCLFDTREQTGERLRNKYQPYYKDETSSTEEEVPRRRQLRKRKRKSEFPKKRKRIIKDYSSSNNSESDFDIQERLKPSSHKASSSKDHRKTRLQSKRKSQSPIEDKSSGNKSGSSVSTAASSDRLKSCKRLKKNPRRSSSHQSRTKDLISKNELNTPEYASVSSPPTPVLSPNPYCLGNDSDQFKDNSDLTIDAFNLNTLKDSPVHYNVTDKDNVNISAVNTSESGTPSPKPRLKSVVKKIESSQEAGCSNWPLHNLRQRKVTRYAYTPYFSISDSDS